MTGAGCLAGWAAFLADCGWGAARRRHLAGDALARGYERVELAGARVGLVEWRGWLGGWRPAGAVTLAHDGDGRRAGVRGVGLGGMGVGRLAGRAAFLADCGWGAARRRHLAGDALARGFERVEMAGARVGLGEWRGWLGGWRLALTLGHEGDGRLARVRGDAVLGCLAAGGWA